MKIEYDTKKSQFIITCNYEENHIVMGMPDRRFRKGSRTWAASALKRNIRYMKSQMNNAQMYSVEALKVYNERCKELDAVPSGEDQFPAWFEFKNEPRDYQAHAFKKFFPLNEAAMLFKQGLGKTFTSINLTAAWRMTNKIEAVVVICPSSIKLVWEDELDKHCPIPTERHVLEAGKYKKADKFIDEKDSFEWFIVGIEALSQGNAIEYVKKFLRTRKCAIIIDESSRIKNPDKTRTERCVALGPMAVKRLILTGTSITQGIENFYSQYKFLNPDILGYDSFYSFRNQYCITKQMDVGNDRPVTKIVGYKNEDELIQSVAPYTMMVDKSAIKDMPEKIFTDRYIAMAPAQKKIYSEMRDEFIAYVDEHESEYEVTTVLEQLMRLQQITGGHYPATDGDTVTTQVIPGKNPKIDELKLILEETEGKMIIWCQFRPEIDLVARALESMQIGYVEFHGGCTDDEKRTAVRSIQNEPATRVFLATRAAAYGLTLTSVTTSIYYSQGYSLEQYEQSQDRNHRIGQDKDCLYIHLLCEKTVDVKVIKALASKKGIADLVYSLLKENN